MVIALWIINAILALFFIAAGGMKLAKAKPALIEGGLAWAESFSPLAIKLIAAAEVLGAIGLIVPLATGIAPILSPIAAVALAIIMIGAVVVHVRRSEKPGMQAAMIVLAIISAVLGFLVVLG